MVVIIVNMRGFEKRRRVRGAQPLPFANKMSHTTLPYCKDGDDMIFTVSMDGFNNIGGLGGAQHPHLQTDDPNSLTLCKHGDGMIFCRKLP